MKRITLSETLTQYKTIEVEDHIVTDPDNPEDNAIIRELMHSATAQGWDGGEVHETQWEVEDVN